MALAIQSDFIDGIYLTVWFWIIETICFRMWVHHTFALVSACLAVLDTRLLLNAKCNHSIPSCVVVAYIQYFMASECGNQIQGGISGGGGEGVSSNPELLFITEARQPLH